MNFIQEGKNMVEEGCLTLKEKALEEARKVGLLESSKASQYRDMLAEYAIYCKEEEFDRFQDMCSDLVNSIPHRKDAEWLYEAWTVEATAQLMQAMGEGVDWDKVSEIVLEQGHTADSMSEVAQLLIAYSPDGLSFVDHIVKPMADYEKMTGLKNAYKTEQYRRIRQERRQRKELGGQLVKCLNNRVLALSKKD